VSALPPDYDTDPARSRAVRVGWQQDVHAPVAERLVAEGRSPVLDVGSGRGRLADALAGRLWWLGADASPRQLADCPFRPVVRAGATSLPFPDNTFAAVAALWMLYHLDRPVEAVREARRVLRHGGLFVACTNSRTSDPELVPEGYRPTTFDAEEAADVVAEVFGEVEVTRWDARMVELADRQAAVDYARSHLLPADVADRVTPPITLTKRGCLVWAVATERGRA
jgi:SAM-dependent methyltransferase